MRGEREREQRERAESERLERVCGCERASQREIRDQRRRPSELRLRPFFTVLRCTQLKAQSQVYVISIQRTVRRHMVPLSAVCPAPAVTPVCGCWGWAICGELNLGDAASWNGAHPLAPHAQRARIARGVCGLARASAHPAVPIPRRAASASSRARQRWQIRRAPRWSLAARPPATRGGGSASGTGTQNHFSLGPMATAGRAGHTCTRRREVSHPHTLN